MASLSLFAPENFPLLNPGQSLLDAIEASLKSSDFELRDKDILVVAQKVVSKSENRFLDLATVEVTPEAETFASQCHKEPRFIQAVLNESASVIRCVPGVFIVRHRLGFCLANAGIDQSNIDSQGKELVLLLPQDPDNSARNLRQGLRQRLGVDIGVVISDSFGRPWRIGTTGVCIGCAGITPVRDQRGEQDLYGRTLQVTQPALGDEIAGAASLLMGEASEGRPLAVLRGLAVTADNTSALSLVRNSNEDLFR
jgi:coenzyme F420-0:L-glutamate ligase/coenzyme F420-1:gamma-L-glutamate ligase